MLATRTTVVVTKMDVTPAAVPVAAGMEWEVREAIATARVAPSYRLISCVSAVKLRGTTSVTVQKMAIPCTILVSEREFLRRIFGRVSSPQSNSRENEVSSIAAL